jgi:hypothetical protein
VHGLEKKMENDGKYLHNPKKSSNFAPDYACMRNWLMHVCRYAEYAEPDYVCMPSQIAYVC